MTPDPKNEASSAGRDAAPGDERISTGTGTPLSEDLLLPGGKVDAEAVRRLFERTEAEGGEGDDAAVPSVTFSLQRDLKKRLDKYLTDRITFMSRNQLQRLIEGGGVLVNGRQPKASTVLRKGDVIDVVVPSPPPTEIQPEEIPLEVLYEDDFLIVINKPPDIIVHPARSHLKGTMVNALAWHFRHVSRSGALSSVGGEFARPGVVHRLDRHTSGVIVFAKQDEAHWKLGHQFEHRRVDKRYMAIVEGRVEPEVDVVELPIGPHPSREKGYREKYVVRHDEQGKHAVTIYRVREQYALEVTQGRSDAAAAWSGVSPAPGRPAPPPPAAAAGWSSPAPSHEFGTPRHAADPSLRRFSLVELELKTGRTHQIRVHLSHLGYPIVGDDMYGGRPYADAAGNVLISRQALHATVLGFEHPITSERMVFTAPLRGDMASLVRDLRERSGPWLERPAAPGATVDLDRALGG